MSLRPRYSLLTLLVLTALVAGGVKLWYGPHHFVERPAANLEDEYTYTRDWRGDKIVHGPRVLRYYRANDTLQRVQIDYYMHGVKTGHAIELMALSERDIWNNPSAHPVSAALSQADKIVFREAVKQEIAKIRQLGFRPGIPGYDYLEEEQLDTQNSLEKLLERSKPDRQ